MAVFTESERVEVWDQRQAVESDRLIGRRLTPETPEACVDAVEKGMEEYAALRVSTQNTRALWAAVVPTSFDRHLNLEDG